MIRESKQILDSIPHHEAVVIEGEEILKKLNPQFAIDKERDERLSKLENKFDTLDSKLDKIFNLVQK